MPPLMTRYAAAIVNGTAVVPREGVRPAAIAIDDGKIAALLDPGERVDADEVIAATGKPVSPGLIEPHMHVGFLGLPMDDVASETRSASVGGVTTVLNYLVFPDRLDEHHAEFLSYIERLAYVDMSLHIGIFTPEHIRAIPHFIEDLGVTSFKHFMSWRGDEASQRGFPPTDDGLLVETMREVARPGGAAAGRAGGCGRDRRVSAGRLSGGAGGWLRFPHGAARDRGWGSQRSAAERARNSAARTPGRQRKRGWSKGRCSPREAS